MITEISAANVQLESRLSLHEWVPTPRLSTRLTQSWSSFSLPFGTAERQLVGFGVHVTRLLTVPASAGLSLGSAQISLLS